MTAEINFWTSRCEYGWLSNFYRAGFTIAKTQYRTVEHWYQSRKYEQRHLQEYVMSAIEPAVAKARGHEFPARPDWDGIKVLVMLEGLRAKFAQNPALRMMLLNTGGAAIHEDSPADLFWGKKGEDVLGRLLMHVREEIREGREIPWVEVRP